MVYYPTFKIVEGFEDMDYMIDGVEGLNRIITGLGFKLPNIFFRFLLHLTIGVTMNAPLADLVEG